VKGAKARMLTTLCVVALLFVSTMVTSEVVITAPAQIIARGMGTNSLDCQNYRAGKATYTPPRVFYTSQISKGFSFSSSGNLAGTLTFSVVKFDVVGNTTRTASTAAAPNPITFLPNASISLSPAGAHPFDLVFAENQQCHPCFLQIQQVVDATTTYSHCTEIGVFSRLNDKNVVLAVRKAANEAIIQPDTVKTRLITGAFATRGFRTESVEIPDTSFTLNAETGQYAIRIILKDNPDATAQQMAVIMLTENVGQVLGVDVVGVSVDGSGDDSGGALDTGTLVGILIGVLAGLLVVGIACMWVRHRNATGQPLCCCQPKSVGSRYR